MALYDQRTFKWRNDWWVGEVHSAFGAGWGDSVPAPTAERVIFTSLSDRSAPSRSAAIPPGWLNRLTHAALGSLLDAAEDWGSRFSMSPRNAPDADELSGLQQMTDDEGLTWVFRSVSRPVYSPTGTEMRPAVELICLDDSALRGEIGFADSTTFEHFLNIHGAEGVRSLIPLITQDKQEIRPSWNA